MNGINMARRAQTGIAFAMLLAAAFGAAGCQSMQTSADKQTAADKQAAAEKSQTLAAGTEMLASLQSTVDTGHNKVGDKISLRTLGETRVQEAVVVPPGATINGEVTHIDPAGRVAGGAELTLRFVELVMPNGTSYAISAAPLRLKGKGDAKESAMEVGGGAVAGGILGGILGGSDDIAKGAAAGAAVGAGVAVATKGDQIVLPAGQKIKVTLDTPVTITTKPGTTS